MQLSQSVAVERHEEPGVGVIGAIWIDNPPVNALSQHVREGLAAAVPAVADDAEMQAAVLVCRGRTFIAGADIREFGKPRLPPDTNEVRRMIEKSP
ncbi:MAG: enoyl-CoA hydratase-related protein, partial [Acidobacteria bacterium]|nr:enoyl-CoA hydratase-related protein [Acidobacteriota bacterium]